MNCSQVKDILLESVDAELGLEVREGMKAHMASCESCARQFEGFFENLQRLELMPIWKAPEGFLGGVHARIQRPARWEWIRSWSAVVLHTRTWVGAMGVATAAILVIVTYHAAMRGPSRQDPMLVQKPLSDSPKPEAKVGGDLLGGKAHDRGSVASVATEAAKDGIGAQSTGLVLTLRLSEGQTAKGQGGKGSVASLTPPPALAPSDSADAHRSPAQPQKRAGREAAKSEGMGAGVRTREAGPPGVAMKSDEVLERVRRLVSQADGSTLEGRMPGGGSEFGTLLVEIPGRNFTAFVDALRLLGEVGFERDEHPGGPPQDTVTLTLRIYAAGKR